MHDRGLTKRAAKDLTGALADFDKAIKKWPNFGLAYANRAMTKLELKNHTEALADAEMAIKLLPKFFAGYNARAMVRFSQNDFQGASNDIDKIFSLEQRNSVRAEAFYDRAMVSLKLGKSEVEYCEDVRVAFALGYTIDDNGYSIEDNVVLEKCPKRKR